MATSRRRRRAIGIGVLLCVVGLVAAVALFVAGSMRRTNAIENFARAPVGCDTTLDFAEGGTYLLFLESVGTFEDVRGDCEAADGYDADVESGDVGITVVDPDGQTLELGDPPSVSYSDGGYAGEAIFTVDIADATDHVIRVESSSSDTFAVAVGRDPSDGVTLLQILGIAAGLVGVGVGLFVALTAGRRDEPSDGTWSNAPGTSPWAAPPPTQPLYRPPPAGVPPAPPGAMPAPGPFAPPSPPSPPSASDDSAPQWGGPTGAQ